MERKATNYDVVKTLSPERLRKLTTVARCLACIKKLCADTEYKPDCITGFQEWLKLEADVNNWEQIMEVISVKDDA